MSRSRRGLLALVILLAFAGAGACVGPRSPRGSAAPLRLGALADHGDAARRASMGLVLDGLDADAAGRPASAATLYERALQVDPTNPWAYLALARHRAEGLNPAQALPVLDQAETLLRHEEAWGPRVEAHLTGLRGMVMLANGASPEGQERLRRARELAPAVWNDGRLDAAELR